MIMIITIESKDLLFQIINVTYTKHKWNYFYKKFIHSQSPLTKARVYRIFTDNPGQLDITQNIK